MHRLDIRLHGHRIGLDPPQHVATLMIEGEKDGHVLELMPSDGEEVDHGVAVLRRLPVSSSHSSATEEGSLIGPGIAAPYLNRLPLVREIDLANLPSEYRRSSSSNVESFEFVSGERYRVTLVSEVTLQTSVVAE